MDDESAVLADITRNGPTAIADICFRTGLSRRTVEAAVQYLRLAHEPIVGGPAGLSLAHSRGEFHAWRESHKRRIAALLETDAAAAETERRMAAADESRWATADSLWDVA